MTGLLLQICDVCGSLCIPLLKTHYTTERGNTWTIIDVWNSENTRVANRKQESKLSCMTCKNRQEQLIRDIYPLDIRK